MSDLTDVEIVAACAKATGHRLDRDGGYSRLREGVGMYEPAWFPFIYNPLTDRAQAMELGESDPVLFAKVVGVWASRGGKDNLLHMICHAFAGKQIEKEKNA